MGSLFRPCQVSFMPWCFKSDDSLLPRGNVEGYHGGLCFVFRLFATCCGLLLVGYGLSYACFGQVCKGLVVLGAAKRIRLPFGTLYLDNLACLGQLTELSNSCLGCYA